MSHEYCTSLIFTAEAGNTYESLALGTQGGKRSSADLVLRILSGGDSWLVSGYSQGICSLNRRGWDPTWYSLGSLAGDRSRIRLQSKL